MWVRVHDKYHVENVSIYVIAASENGPTKIGYSGNPEARLRQLQTGHSGRLRLWHVESVDKRMARQIEKKIHTQILHMRTSGEWFSISTSDAIAEIRFGMMFF